MTFIHIAHVSDKGFEYINAQHRLINLLRQGGTAPLPEISMFCALSQNYQPLFEN